MFEVFLVFSVTPNERASEIQLTPPSLTSAPTIDSIGVTILPAVIAALLTGSALFFIRRHYQVRADLRDSMGNPEELHSEIDVARSEVETQLRRTSRRFLESYKPEIKRRLEALVSDPSSTAKVGACPDGIVSPEKIGSNQSSEDRLLPLEKQVLPEETARSVKKLEPTIPLREASRRSDSGLDKVWEKHQ